MRLIALTGLVCLGLTAAAQTVTYDYDRSANFSAYRTYQWVDMKSGRAADQLIEQNIKRAIDSQLAAKGLQRVDSGADLHISYQVAIEQERQFDGWGSGPRWYGTARVTTSTIDVGRLAVGIYDPARQQMIWRGTAEKTLDIKKDPEKNYENLQKAMAKLFKSYPPATDK